jgi:hypothetical protein
MASKRQEKAIRSLPTLAQLFPLPPGATGFVVTRPPMNFDFTDFRHGLSWREIAARIPAPTVTFTYPPEPPPCEPSR